VQAVILAAGLGTRMGELTKDCPKPLLTIQNKSLLEHGFASLPDSVDEVVLVVGYLGVLIKQLIGESHGGRRVRYVEQRELKGTGHALSLCKGILKGSFLVLMGDDLYQKEDLEEMVRDGLSMLVLEIKEDKPKAQFALVTTDGQGQPLDIKEKQPGKKGDLANCGAYVLDERYFALPLVPAKNNSDEYGLPQTMLQLLKKGVEFRLVKANFWHKVTGPEDLELSK